MPLANRYLLMRHGHSQANAAGLIVSDPVRGVAGFGLSARGEAQLAACIDAWQGPAPDAIYHSDFMRTTQTAQRLADHFGLALTPHPGLRERYFAAFDGKDDGHYAEVWARDARDPEHRHAGVESVAQVAARLTAVIDALERRHANQTLLLVSHGDPLQILLTALEGRPLSEHRDRPPLAPASLTRLPHLAYGSWL